MAARTHALALATLCLLACNRIDVNLLSQPIADAATASDAAAGRPGADSDAAITQDGGSDAGPLDGETPECIPNPDLDDQVCPDICRERCNGEDDDCDRAVDEEEAASDCDGLPNTTEAICSKEDTGCQITACQASHLDCDDNPDNGCEAPIDSVDTCGTCDNPCALTDEVTKVTCNESDLDCEIARCVDGFADCDSLHATGCEIDVRDDVEHCGACNHDCLGLGNVDDASCVEGACVLDGCEAPFTDCDGDPDNGCEWDLGVAGCEFLTVDNTDNVALTDHQVLLRVDATAPTPPAANCTYATFDGHGYHFCTDALDWDSAHDSCRAVGMELTHIDNSEENTFVAATRTAAVWLGARTHNTIVPGRWRWWDTGARFWEGADVASGGITTCASDKPSTGCTYPLDGGLYSSWYDAGGEPDEGSECGAMRASDPDWRAQDCTTTLDYVCEVDLGEVNGTFWSQVAIDGSDIRFHGSTGDPLPHWVQQWDHSGQRALIWVRVDQLPGAGVATLSLRYGTGNPDTADIASTMEFGDDFGSGTLDPLRWDTTNADTDAIWSVIAGTGVGGFELRSVSTGTPMTGRLQSLAEFHSDTLLQLAVKYKLVAPATNGLVASALRGTATGGCLPNNCQQGFMSSAGGNDRWVTHGSVVDTGFASIFDVWTLNELSAFSGWMQIRSRDHGDPTITRWSSFFGSSKPQARVTLGHRLDDTFPDEATDVRWDWIYVRKLAASEPQVSFAP